MEVWWKVRRRVQMERAVKRMAGKSGEKNGWEWWKVRQSNSKLLPETPGHELIFSLSHIHNLLGRFQPPLLSPVLITHRHLYSSLLPLEYNLPPLPTSNEWLGLFTFDNLYPLRPAVGHFLFYFPLLQTVSSFDLLQSFSCFSLRILLYHHHYHRALIPSRP